MGGQTNRVVGATLEEQLMNYYYPSVLGMCRRCGMTEDETGDVVVKFCELCQQAAANGYRPGTEEARTYIAGRYQRWRNWILKRREQETKEKDELTCELNKAYNRLAYSYQMQHIGVVRDEFNRRFWKDVYEVACISDMQRHIIRLMYEEGLGVYATASRLGLTVYQLRSRLSKIKSRLRLCWVRHAGDKQFAPEISDVL